MANEPDDGEIVRRVPLDFTDWHRCPALVSVDKQRTHLGLSFDYVRRSQRPAAASDEAPSSDQRDEPYRSVGIHFRPREGEDGVTDPVSLFERQAKSLPARARSCSPARTPYRRLQAYATRFATVSTARWWTVSVPP